MINKLLSSILPVCDDSGFICLSAEEEIVFGSLFTERVNESKEVKRENGKAPDGKAPEEGKEKQRKEKIDSSVPSFHEGIPEFNNSLNASLNAQGITSNNALSIASGNALSIASSFDCAMHDAKQALHALHACNTHSPVYAHKSNTVPEEIKRKERKERKEVKERKKEIRVKNKRSLFTKKPPLSSVEKASRMRRLAGLQFATVKQLQKDAFWEKVEKTNSCWIWMQQSLACSYDKQRLAPHALAWMLCKKITLKDDEYLKSTCGNHYCVNPDHRVVTKHGFKRANSMLKAKLKKEAAQEAKKARLLQQEKDLQDNKAGKISDNLRYASILQNAVEDPITHCMVTSNKTPRTIYKGLDIKLGRLVYILATGTVPPIEQRIMHSCHNPRCVNINHLYLAKPVCKTKKQKAAKDERELKNEAKQAIIFELAKEQIKKLSVEMKLKLIKETF